MIVVDSSVLIDFLRRADTPQVLTLRTIEDPNTVIIGDLVLLEVLRGARDDLHAARLRRDLGGFSRQSMLNERIALRAAENFRRLRSLGKTVRKTPDLIIGTFCIENRHALLHSDRDFDPMVEHLGLRVI